MTRTGLRFAFPSLPEGIGPVDVRGAGLGSASHPRHRAAAL